MTWKEIVARLRAKLATITDEAQRSELEKEIADLEKQEPDPVKKDPPATPPDSTDTAELIREVAALKEQNRQVLDALAAERKAREEGTKSIAEQQAAVAKKEREERAAKAIEAAAITPEEKDLWLGRLEKDPEEWGKELDARIAAKQSGGKGGTPPKAGEKPVEGAKKQEGRFASALPAGVMDVIEKQLA